MGWLKELLAWLRTTPALLWELLGTTALVCAALLVLPWYILEWLGFSQFEQTARPIVAIVGISALALLSVHGAAEVVRYVRHKVRSTKEAEARRKRLHALTFAEQAILREYISRYESRTRPWGEPHGVVLELQHEGILRRVSEQDQHGRAPYSIEAWAWDYLRDRPELVGAKARRDPTDNPAEKAEK